MAKKIFIILTIILTIINLPPSYEDTFSQSNVVLRAIRKNEDFFVQILAPLDVKTIKVEIVSENGAVKSIIYKDYYGIRSYPRKKYNEFIISNRKNDILDGDIIKVFYKATIIAEGTISSIPYITIVSNENIINEESKLIRIATYNIHRGRDKTGYSNLKEIGEFIKYYDIDIIGLQEVDKNVPRTNFEDQLKKLADKLSMYYYFGSNKSFLKGEYGNGILSKYPLLNPENILLQGKEARGLLKTTILIGQNKKLNFMVTHLGLDVDERQKQFNNLSDYIDIYEEDLILVGDFNVTDIDPNILSIQQKLNDIGEKTMHRNVNTLNIFRNEYRIDYVFASKSMGVKKYNVEKVQYSDHFPVIVEIEY
ncbi:MAG: endonuclease/exonuclease/phosphatase family protein [Tissierellales bacterium]